MTVHQADFQGKSSTSSPPEAIWRCHEHWLRTIVYARLREWTAVEDVLQETALAWVRSNNATTAAEFSPGKWITAPESVGPWLYRVAIRQVLLYRRRQGRKQKLIENITRHKSPSEADAAEPLDWLLSLERQSMVRQALTKLPPRDAQILLLKYTENWSYQQIAERLGLSHASVESRLHRARAKLREELTS